MSKNLVILVQERTLGRGKRMTAVVRKAVLMAMAAKADDDGSSVYASQTTLAALAECSRRAFQYTIDELEDEKLIKRCGERGQQIVWQLNIARLEKLPLAVKPAHPVRRLDAPVATKPAHPVRRSAEKPAHPVRQTSAPRALQPAHPVRPTLSNDSVHDSKNPPTPLRGNGSGVSGGDAMLPFELTGGPKDDGFQAAWLMWPQKGRSDKRAAQELWAELVKAHAPVMLKAAVEAYLNSEEAQRKRGQYIPAFERWLKKRVEAWVEMAKDPSKGDQHGNGAANGIGKYDAHALRTGSKRNAILRAAMRRELHRQQQGAGHPGAGKPGPEIGAGPNPADVKPGE